MHNAQQPAASKICPYSISVQKYSTTELEILAVIHAIAISKRNGHSLVVAHLILFGYVPFLFYEEEKSIPLSALRGRCTSRQGLLPRVMFAYERWE